MSTHDRFFKQTDGLAMGSPLAPHLANGWLSQFDDVINGNAALYERFFLRGIRASPFHLLVHDRSQATSTVVSSWMGDLPGVVPSKSTLPLSVPLVRGRHRVLRYDVV